MIPVYSGIRQATSKLTLRAARPFALVLLAVVFAFGGAVSMPPDARVRAVGGALLHV